MKTKQFATPVTFATHKQTISNAFLWVMIFTLGLAQGPSFVDKQCERWPVEIWGYRTGWSTVAAFDVYLVAACVKGRDPTTAVITAAASASATSL